MSIQDSIRKLVIPRIETLVKSSVVLGDTRGRAILTALSIPITTDPSHVVFTMKFRCSYVDEWVTELTKLRNDINKYPFLFVNARGIIYEGQVVTIPEMVVATRTSKEWKAEQRDDYTQNPILWNLTSYLEDTLECFFGTDGEFHLRTERVYNSKLDGTVGEFIDAVIIKQTKLRILNC